MHPYFKDYRQRVELRVLAPVLLFAAVSACAQPSIPAAPAPSSSVSMPETVPPPANTTSPAAPAAAQGPAYTASNIALAFTYIDASKDGKLSREEAAGFRGVARHFDQADVDKDSFLSREEFENAMNRSKPK